MFYLNINVNKSKCYTVYLQLSLCNNDHFFANLFLQLDFQQF